MFTGIAVVVALVAVTVALLGLRLLLGRHWLRGWLRGTTGLLLTAAAVALVLAALDLQGYRRLLAEQPVAELAFSAVAPRHWRVELTEPAAAPRHFELHGELWQLDVRLLRWHPSLLRLGIRPGYRLDRLSGRYHRVEDELALPRTVIALDGDGADTAGFWQWLGQREWLPLVDAYYGSGAFLPMRDGARFTVSLGPSGLVARPLNSPARAAVEQWR